jgi:NitT/TauT family transport system ATP-binding protein
MWKRRCSLPAGYQRPAHIKAEIASARPYPRHRGDPHLAELRHQVLAHLGLDATW